MMNSERLAVGIQGLGIGEASYRGAVAYAGAPAGRSLSGAKYPDKPAIRFSCIRMCGACC